MPRLMGRSSNLLGLRLSAWAAFNRVGGDDVCSSISTSGFGGSVGLSAEHWPSGAAAPRRAPALGLRVRREPHSMQKLASTGQAIPQPLHFMPFLARCTGEFSGYFSGETANLEGDLEGRSLTYAYDIIQPRGLRPGRNANEKK